MFGRCEPTTGIDPFDRLVTQVMTSPPYASARRVFWIVDNGSSHRGQASIDRLQSRWYTLRLIHLPKHASWLNQVEIYLRCAKKGSPRGQATGCSPESALGTCTQNRQQIARDLTAWSAIAAENPVMTWNVKGTYIETCSCDFFCPCNFSFAHGADYDRCRVTLVFNITEGDVEGTDVGGLVVAVVADTPKVMTEGNWRVGVLIDDKASDEQADKLVGVFSGQLGGPMAALGPLIGENLGVQRATIEVQENGLRHSVRIGDAVDFEIEDVVPFGIETGEPVRVVGMFHPAGSEFRVAEAKRANINAFGIAYQGKSGVSAPQFSWAA